MKGIRPSPHGVAVPARPEKTGLWSTIGSLDGGSILLSIIYNAKKNN